MSHITKDIIVTYGTDNYMGQQVESAMASTIADRRWKRTAMQEMADEIVLNVRDMDPQEDERFNVETKYPFQLTQSSIQSLLFAGKRFGVSRGKDGRTLSFLVKHEVTFKGHGEGFVQFEIRGDIETKEVESVDVFTGLCENFDGEIV